MELWSALKRYARWLWSIDKWVTAQSVALLFASPFVLSDEAGFAFAFVCMSFLCVLGLTLRGTFQDETKRMKETQRIIDAYSDYHDDMYLCLKRCDTVAAITAHNFHSDLILSAYNNHPQKDTAHGEE
jgi:hypothetical protein